MSRKQMPFGRLPCIGDFEASSLDRDSYPVEVAWSLPSGEISSRLIRPVPAEWGDYWDPYSAFLHKITPEMLDKDGIKPAEIVSEMNRDLGGEVLYFDGGVYDQMWPKQHICTSNRVWPGVRL